MLLDSDEGSATCYALQTAFYTALDSLSNMGKSILMKDGATGLVFTGFNSFPDERKYDWEKYIGRFGSANKFYGVAVSKMQEPPGASEKREPAGGAEW